jgi:ABC-type polysaccharide/polyol phosphate export permease
MLWTLLTLISSFLFLISAVAAATHAKVGIESYLVAIILGLLLAVCNFLMMEKAANSIVESSKSLSHAAQNRRLRLLYISACIWALVAAFVGEKVTSLILRLVG